MDRMSNSQQGVHELVSAFQMRQLVKNDMAKFRGGQTPGQADRKENYWLKEAEETG